MVFVIGLVLLATAVPDASAIVIAIGAVVQPYVQEALVRHHIEGRGAVALTVGVSLLTAVVATWVTGGFAGTVLPAFTLADPSPLFAYLWPKWASVYALASLTFHLAPDRVGSVPTSPQAVAGTA